MRTFVEAVGRRWTAYAPEAMPGFSLVLALAFGAASLAARKVPSRLLLALALLAALPLVLSVATDRSLGAWAAIPGCVGAVAGGVLLGRAVPARAAPMLAVLLVLSVLDTSQLLYPWLGHDTGSGAPDVAASKLRVPLPFGDYEVGFADLLLVSALAEHARRRGFPLRYVLAPGVLGFALADIAVAAGAHSGVPLFPFLAAAWFVGEAACRRATPRAARGPTT